MFSSEFKELYKVEIVDENVEARIIDLIKIIHMKIDYKNQIKNIEELIENI